MFKMIKVLICTNALLACALGAQHLLQSQHKLTQSEININTAAHYLEGRGVMSADTYRRTATITDRISKNKTATNAEVKELLTVAANRDRSKASDMIAFEILPCLYEVKKFSPTQREAIFRFCVAEFNYASKTQKANCGYGAALTLCQVMNEKRAFAYILPLQSSPNRYIAKWTKDTVKIMQR